MNDRELLEMAAIAAGVRHIEYDNDYDGRHGLQLCDAVGRHMGSWNPLNDDGDALRLAVLLQLDVHTFTIRGDTLVTGCNRNGVPLCILSEPHGVDKYAATRRAIVRAAAELEKDL